MVEPLNTKAWVLVPVAPTPEMVEAGWIDKEDVTPSEVWASMLSASPSLPAVDGGEVAGKLRSALVVDPNYGPSVRILTLGYDDIQNAATLIATQQQEIERLSGLADGYGKLDAEFAIAESRVQSLEKALRQSVTMIEDFARNQPRNVWPMHPSSVERMLSEARAALSGEKP